MAGMIIDVIAGKNPDEAELGDDAEGAPVAPESDAESLISSIESQLAELRAMVADLG